MLKIAHPNSEDRTEIKIHIPFLRNIEGLSPLHLFNDNNEFRYMNTILEYLAAYDIDHHSRAIYEILPSILGQDTTLPHFITYLQSRVKQTETARLFTKGMLKS